MTLTGSDLMSPTEGSLGFRSRSEFSERATSGPRATGLKRQANGVQAPRRDKSPGDSLRV